MIKYGALSTQINLHVKAIACYTTGHKICPAVMQIDVHRRNLQAPLLLCRPHNTMGAPSSELKVSKCCRKKFVQASHSAERQCADDVGDRASVTTLCTGGRRPVELY